MTNKEEIIRELISKNDLERLKDIIGDIRRLIDQNPFSERINYLINHQELSKKPVINLHEELEVPNCIGTALWIAGVSSLDHPYHGYEGELNEHMKDENDKRDELTKILWPNLNNKIPGAFVFSYDPRTDWHAGIFLGTITNEDILFAQHGFGKNFGPESILNCYRPQYFLPRTLKDKPILY